MNRRLIVLLGALLAAGLVAWALLVDPPPYPSPDDEPIAGVPDAADLRTDSPGGPQPTSTGITDKGVEPTKASPPRSVTLERSRKKFVDSDTATPAKYPRLSRERRQELAMMSPWERRSVFDFYSAASLGLSQEEIDWIHSRWQAAEEAIRSDPLVGESGVRVRPRARFYDQELRQHLTEDEFDVVLFVTGQTNRIVLAAPKEGGAPLAEGLRAGDMILSYDGEPVYRVFDLPPAINATEHGAEVPIVVQRGNEKIELTVPGQHRLGPKQPARRAPLLY